MCMHYYLRRVIAVPCINTGQVRFLFSGGLTITSDRLRPTGVTTWRETTKNILKNILQKINLYF